MAKDDDPPPAAHWGTKHPEEQPSYGQVAGLGRMVQEALNRMGPSATPEAVAAELRDAGVETDAEEVARWFEQPD